ncbi:MAG: DUF4349 domain-containing protein [Treponema sp.]|nr:DUF4349 domain-containing protein [Treponema sp.]
MKKRIFVLVLLTALLVFGCSRGGSLGHSADLGNMYSYDSEEQFQSSFRIPSVAYDDSLYTHRTTRYEGMGFNPEGPAGLESSAPIVFRDMSNIFGNITQDERDRRVDPNSPYSGGRGETPSSNNDSISSNLNTSQHKLIKRGSLRFRVEDLEASDAFIISQLEKYNGYSASTAIVETSHTYSLRVPAEHYDIFVTELGDLGRLLNRTESTEDVTIRYYDLEGRLESRRELLRTYQSYLSRARNIEEILSVEARIADLQREIDSTGSQLRNLSNLIEYATVNLTIYGPTSAPVRYENSLGERIVNLFKGFGGFLSSIAVIIIGFIVYGVPLLAILLLIIWVFFGRIGLLKKLWLFVFAKKA